MKYYSFLDRLNRRKIIMFYFHPAEFLEICNFVTSNVTQEHVVVVLQDTISDVYFTKLRK